MDKLQESLGILRRRQGYADKDMQMEAFSASMKSLRSTRNRESASTASPGICVRFLAVKCCECPKVP